MIHKTRWSLLLGALCTSAALAQSPDVKTHPDVSLALANQVLNATLEACHADQHTAVAAVVDRGGNLVALQRDDNIGPHNTQAAQRKAFTALSMKTPTRQLSESARNNPESQNLATVSDLLLLGGGKVTVRSSVPSVLRERVVQRPMRDVRSRVSTRCYHRINNRRTT